MEQTGAAYKGRSSLTVRLDKSGFSFSLYDPASEEGFRFIPYAVNPLISMMANVKEALQSQAVLKEAYGQVNFLLTGQTALVPAAIFKEEDAETYFRFQYPSMTGCEIVFNHLPHTQTVLVFPMEKGLQQMLLDEYPDAAFYSVLSSVTEHFCGLSRLGNNRKLYLYFYNGNVCIEVFDRGKLNFMNVFDFEKHKENVLYYVAYVWKVCGLDAEEDRIYLTGDLGDLKSSLMEQLRRFYRNVFYINPSAEFNEVSVSKTNRVPYDVQSLLVFGF